MSLGMSVAAADAAHHRRFRAGKIGDWIFLRLTSGFALFVLLLLAAIMVSLAIGAWPALKAMGFGFFTREVWNPVTAQFGLLAPVYGTLVTSFIALLIGVPVSFGIALFLTELSPRWLKQPVGTAIELLAAIPSIIYGMWGLFVFAPFLAAHVQPWLNDHVGSLPLVGNLFSGPPLGIGMGTAGVILAIMIVPFVAAVMRDVFDTVPPIMKESAYALGATTWEVVANIVLPLTRTSVMGGIMLGLGRALGETMAVTFVIGNSHNVAASLFLPGSTISSVIANEFTEADGEVYTSSLIALGLNLFVITFIVLALAKFMLLRIRLKAGV